MILNEQLLKKKNRIFYHGSKQKVLDIDNANYDWLFITTDINNAIMYCEKEEDIRYLHMFKLKKPLNIFNARSKVDYSLLQKTLLHKERVDFVNNELYKLKDYDWLFLDDTNISRTEMACIIQNLGYDGFFNFEWTSDEMAGAHFELESLPSIGIFDIDNLESLGILSFDEIKKDTKYDNLKQKSKEKIINEIKPIIEYCSLFKQKYGKLPNNDSIEQRIKNAIGRNYYTTLTDNEINNIINDTIEIINKNGIRESSKDLFESYGKCKMKGIDFIIPTFAKRLSDEQNLEFEKIYEKDK